MRKSLLLLTLIALLVSAAAALAADATIIGTPKCKMCHGAKTGDQFKLWSESSHAGAFETLKTEAAIAAATAAGLGNAWEAPECLKCHTTAAFLGAELDAKTKYVPEEGVGCEACHGAGSEYKAKSIMVDYDASVAAGMTADPKVGCVSCHNEESPTFKGFDFDTYWAKIAHPVPTAE